MACIHAPTPGQPCACTGIGGAARSNPPAHGASVRHHTLDGYSSALPKCYTNTRQANSASNLEIAKDDSILTSVPLPPKH